MSDHCPLPLRKKKKQIWISISRNHLVPTETPGRPYSRLSLSLFFDVFFNIYFRKRRVRSQLASFSSPLIHACLFSGRRSRGRLIFTTGMVCILRLRDTVLMASVVSVIGIKCGACCLVAHRLLAIRWRAGIASVSLAVARLLIAALVVSRLVVVHFVGVIVFVVSSRCRLALGRATAEPAGPVHGLNTAPTVSSCDAPIAMSVSIHYD